MIYTMKFDEFNYSPLMVTLMDTMLHFEYIKDIKHAPCQKSMHIVVFSN